MSLSSKIDPRIYAASLGVILGFVLVVQFSDQIGDWSATDSVRLTHAEVADALTLVTELCDRIDLHTGANHAQLTSAQLAHATGLVSEFCAETISQPDWKDERPYRMQTADIEIPL